MVQPGGSTGLFRCSCLMFRWPSTLDLTRHNLQPLHQLCRHPCHLFHPIVIQVSWHGRRWWKELGDPEKGFYGWVRSSKTMFLTSANRPSTLFSNWTICPFCNLCPIFRFATDSTFRTVLHTRCKVLQYLSYIPTFLHSRQYLFLSQDNIVSTL